MAESPLGVYLAAIVAGLTGFIAANLLDAALATGLGGLSSRMLVLALDRMPGYVAGLARVIGWTPIIIGLLSSLATPAGAGVLVWHAFRGLRTSGSQGQRLFSVSPSKLLLGGL